MNLSKDTLPDSSSSILGALHNAAATTETKTPEKNPEHTSSFLRRCVNLLSTPITALTALSQIVGAKADSVYLEDIQTNTSYMLNFRASDFPDLRSKVSEFCSVIFNAAPLDAYHAVGVPQCRSDDDVLGPSITVSVEATKAMAKSFQRCLTEAMEPMCDNYFDNHTVHPSTDGNTVAIIVLCIAGAAAIGGLCYYLCSRDNDYCPPPAYRYRTQGWQRMHNNSWSSDIPMTNITIYENDSSVFFPPPPPPYHHSPERSSSVVWNDVSNDAVGSDSHWHSSVEWNSP